ncbi:ABC transporter permease subunit [Georgenia ruanii]|uniref:ABC transporter permease subunit n=1 Tax=Georgenia ruanii TaxID=348442 RepID=A0A7J9UW49_9MICO|nr:ABC transporter permease subunit [Georgenia ruanii]MPV88110.1 ABC transporter permease subunit [Georgenia ruanii]
MSTATAAPATRGRAAEQAQVRARLTFPGVMRGEWIKLFSLRSTWWSLGLTVALMTLIGLAGAASMGTMAVTPDGAAMLEHVHGAEFVASGYQMAMVTVAVLGALLITGEYSTGMIRSTLAAVPTRLPVLAAKAIALTLLTVVVGVIGLALSYLVTIPFLSDHDLVPSLSDTQTWQVFGGTIFFLVMAALFALGIGTLLRSTAGAVTISLVVLLLLPGILQFIRIDWVQDVVNFLPMPAAMAFLSVSDTFGGNDLLTAWEGVAVVAAYAVAVLAAAAVVLRRRDA